MKTLLFFLILAVAMPLAAWADDKVDSYDTAKMILVLDRGGILKTYHLNTLTEFTINGERESFDKLVPGMVVTVALSDPQTLARITAHAAVMAKGNGHSFVLKMRVDGADTVRIKNGQLTIEHKNWDRPDEIFINGVEWKPVWNDNLTEPFKGFNPPLLPFGQSKPVLRQTSGRERVLLDRIQGASDAEKVMTIRFNDPEPGSDIYEVHVSWPVE